MLTIEEAMKLPNWEKQVELETDMRSLGIEKFRKAAEKAKEKGQETRMAPVRRMMMDCHEKMLAALHEFYAEVEAKKAGRKHSAYPYLKGIDHDDLVAHVTCKVILDVAVQRKSLSHVAVMIAEMLEDECNFRLFKEQHTAGYLKAVSRVKDKTNERYKRRSVKATASKLGVNLLEWPKRDMILVGSKLIEMFVEATHCARVVDGIGNRKVVESVPEARAWIEEESRRCELLTPQFMPCVIPPKPWTTPYDGGYWTGRARKLVLVKSPNRAYLEDLADRPMPIVYEAVNALQNTGWTINPMVLEVMTYLFERNSRCGVVPQIKPEKEPNKPLWLVEGLKKEDMTPEQLEEFIAWKSRATEVIEKNAEQLSKSKAFNSMLGVAKRFKDEPAFYYPYQLDWRGRAYPVGLYLQPQGNDAQRGLLQFADFVAIEDQEAANWLMIHGAGLWGKDKGSFEDRIEWIKQHEEQILASAADPYENRFWMYEEKDGKMEDNEKAWQALAFCFDYAGFVREGFGYMSRLPIQMDGTCNGIQNFSAMLLDARGGAAVNLVPADKPQDIYSEVMEVVKKRVAEDAAGGGKPEHQPLAAMWVGNIVRKTVKRPVMTLAYGAKRFGFTDMVMQDTVRVWKKERPETYPFGTQGFQAAQYLGGCIWEAVQEVVVAAAEAMRWLQDVARIVSKEALPIYWTTPTGLLVLQQYKLRDMKNILMTFQKVVIQVKVDKGSDKLDSKKQASGIAPNWVHSLDASHMMLTIRAAMHAGVHSFSFIHDSYGTHAGNTAKLARILREEFVKMYGGECVLERFRADLQAMLPEGVQLPPVPTKGSLDLNQVLESKFFFA
jgi:DNA-directed RNA polymerase